MKNKIIFAIVFVSMVVVEMLPVSVQAGGSHDHEISGHEMVQKENHQHAGEGSAVGKAGVEADATQTIQVVTKDSMRYVFSPEPDIKSGDIVTFIITNEGQVSHEFSIGDKSEQDTHRKMMQNMPDMVHEDGNTITVKPGETKKLTWNFSGIPKGSHDVIVACNIPGHFEAGMFHKMTISQQGVMTRTEKSKPDNEKHHDMDPHDH